MIKMFAIEVSNIAVRNLSFSGVFIVGNIISSLKDYLLQNKD
jgi:glucokinase